MGLLLELAQGGTVAEGRTPAPLNCCPVPTQNTGRSPAELLALVECVARAYRTPPGELAEMKRLALANPAAAWSAFLATAQTEGIH